MQIIYSHPLASSSLLDIIERLMPLLFGRPTCFKSTLLMISDRFPFGNAWYQAFTGSDTVTHMATFPMVRYRNFYFII